MKMNQNKDALNEFYQALSYKENLDVRLGIVALCFKLNQPLRAKEELIKAVKRHPLNQQVKQYLANILLNEGKVSKAGALMLFSDKDASYASLIASANLNFRKGNLDNALELYKKAKAINTDGEEALLGLGNTYFAKNKYDKAQEYWNVVLKKNPSNPMALEGLGMINFKEDRDSIAFEYYQKAIKQNPNYQFSYDAYISFGYILLNHDNIGSASQCFSYAINLKKRNPWARAGLGFCLAQNPGFIYNKLLYSEANRQFKKAVKMDSEVPNFFAYLGITEHLMEKNNRAVKHLEKAMAENPGDSRMLIAIANCYAALYQFEKAKDAIGKAMQMDSKNPEYLVNAGAIECSYAEYLTIKNIPADVDSVLGVMQHYYDKALQAGADTSLIRINTGVGFLGSGRFDSALVYYNKITRTDSLISAAKLNNIGVVMAMKNEMEDAKEYFNKAGSFDANSRYSVIGNNILSSAVEGSLRERQFTSIFYFYPALSDFNPEIGFDLNVPVVAALPMPPGELEEGFSYQNYKHFKYVIEVRAVAKIKQPTHKPWGHCPGS
jgi:tetratricopeptide (TPR) repeat protein